MESNKECVSGPQGQVGRERIINHHQYKEDPKHREEVGRGNDRERVLPLLLSYAIGWSKASANCLYPINHPLLLFQCLPLVYLLPLLRVPSWFLILVSTV